MKQRLITVVIAFIVSIGCISIAYPKFSDFRAKQAKIIENRGILSDTENILYSLEQEFRELRGADAPRTLKTAVNYIMQLDDAEIIQIQSYLENGNGVNYIENVTNMSYDTLCDGFEIELSITDFDRLMQHLDESGLTFHSADFLFGARKAVLRVRLGGNYSG